MGHQIEERLGPATDKESCPEKPGPGSAWADAVKLTHGGEGAHLSFPRANERPDAGLTDSPVVGAGSRF